MMGVRSQFLRPMSRLGLLVLPLSLAAVAGIGSVPPASAAGPSHGRHYELVTPADKYGQGAYVKGVSPDGRVVHFGAQTGNGLPGAGGVGPVFNVFLSRRDDRRWEYFPMNLPTAQLYKGINVDATVGQDVHLFRGTLDPATLAAAFFVRRPGQAPQQISPEIVNLRGTVGNPINKPLFSGASADLTHVVFTGERGGSLVAEVSYLDSDPPAEPDGTSPRKLYESVAGMPVLRRVDVDDSEVPIGGACGGDGLLQVTLGSISLEAQVERAVSADGRRIFFSTSPDCVDRRVYARIDGESTVEVSASECDRVADPGAVPPVTACADRVGNDDYQSASAAGDAVYFHSPNQLVDGDVDATVDLYRYDFDAPSGARLSKVSGGANATPDAGADLRGVVRISADGNRAYFVAGAVLTTAENARQQTAVAGQNNLYVYEAESDSVRFVATLDEWGDWATFMFDDTFRQTHLADAEGRYLVFGSVARLTADDTDSAKDIYRYDGDTGLVERISVGRGGFGSNGNEEIAAAIPGVSNHQGRAATSSENRIVSVDGQRIVFSTPEALEAGDVNGAWDVYEWADGDVRLISDGVSAGGTADPATSGYGASNYRISADGSTVAFSTATRLLPDRDGDSAEDVYVARLGADVDPLPEPPPAPCSGDDCQGRGSGAPVLPAAGSVGFVGQGNVRPGISVGVSKLRAVVGPAARLRVRVPGAGRISVTGSSVRRAKRSASKRGTYSVQIVLSPAAKRQLRKKKTLKISARVSYRAKDGRSTSKKVSITFKQPKAKPAKTNKKGRS